MQVLVIDVGTSSIRGILFDELGHPLHMKQYGYQPCRSADGRSVEQPAEEFYKGLHWVCRALSGTDRWKKGIDAIALTSQRSSVVPVNRQGRALHPVIMWQDQRAMPIAEEKNRIYGAELYGIFGMASSPVHAAPKMLYIKRRYLSLYAHAYKLVGIMDYLLYHLTGHFATDYSLASRSALLDMKHFCWSERLIEIFELQKEKLCELVCPGSQCGVITASAAEALRLPDGIPVITSGGDQQCAVLGCGARKPGDAVINIGTGAYAAIICGEMRPVPDKIAVSAAVHGHNWILESSVPMVGPVVDSICKRYFGGDYSRFEQACAGWREEEEILARLDLSEQWNGISGISYRHASIETSPDRLARALMKAVVSSVAVCFRRVASFYGASVARIFCGGGLTRMDLLCQGLADELGCAVMRCMDCEATGQGAWYVAAERLGIPCNCEREACCFLPGEQEKVFTEGLR